MQYRGGEAKAPTRLIRSAGAYLGKWDLQRRSDCQDPTQVQEHPLKRSRLAGTETECRMATVISRRRLDAQILLSNILSWTC